MFVDPLEKFVKRLDPIIDKDELIFHIPYENSEIVTSDNAVLRAEEIANNVGNNFLKLKHNGSWVRVGIEDMVKSYYLINGNRFNTHYAYL